MTLRDQGTVRLLGKDTRPSFWLRECLLQVLTGPDAGKTFTLGAGATRIGHGGSNEIALADPSVSRDQAVITDGEDGLLFRDLGSTNGTRVNGMRVREVYLENGARLEMGQTVLALRVDQKHVPIEPSPAPRFHGLIGESPAMRELFGYLEKLGQTDLGIVLIGETGTGKEEVARALHLASRRSNRPYVVFDGASTETSLVGAALFGHEEGAYTGASRERKGAFRSADGGTLFIDEVGELPLELQPKLLRVLERREVQPLGSDRAERVDVRVIGATHRNLEQMVKEGKFRQDLFYRLSGLVLELPPLRRRREDILPLALHFLAQAGRDFRLDDSARSALEAHDWPGNVRELKNVIDRAVALAPSSRITASELTVDRLRPGSGATVATATVPVASVDAGEAPAGRNLDEVERRTILEVLQSTSYNISLSSKLLGVTRQTLRNKMERFGLKKPGQDTPDDDE